MKKLWILAVGMLTSFGISAQVGIGTLTPNSKSLLDLNSSTKGLLLPRMSASDRASMPLTVDDAGMLVYQTVSPKGIYLWDGTGWIFNAPVENGGSNGHTLRWDGTKWVSVSNLFNQGTSIGIGTQNPNTQLQINSNSSPTTRLQFTNSFTGSLAGDGLLLGIALANGSAHLIQQENRYLSFGTNALERMRIDSIGRVGINTSNPTATLEVNGTFKLGSGGTPLQNIMRMDYECDPPEIAAFAEWYCNIACPGTLTNAIVYVSPGNNMDHIMIGYARVNVAGNIQVKLMNMSTSPINLSPTMLHVAIIQ